MYKLLFSENFLDSELDKLHFACKDWGFFQLINHGVGDQLVENIKSGIQELFELPMEEKYKMWQKPGGIEGFGQAFVISEEQKLNGGDLFGIVLLPSYWRKPPLILQPSSSIKLIHYYMHRSVRIPRAMGNPRYERG